MKKKIIQATLIRLYFVITIARLYSLIKQYNNSKGPAKCQKELQGKMNLNSLKLHLLQNRVDSS